MIRGQNRTGFTIIELLVVIVILAILASITIVAFNGIQDRANSVSMVMQAKAYVKGLKTWEIELGSRPDYISCIAPASSVPSGMCGTTGIGVNTPRISAFNDSLNDYSGVRNPMLGKWGNTGPVGSMWYSGNYYGENRSVLGYAVGPNSDCEVGNVLSFAAGQTWLSPGMTLSGARYTERANGRTLCVIQVSP